VSVPDAPSLDLASAVTLEAWINPDTLAFTGTFGTILAKSNFPVRNYGLWVYADASLHLSYINGGGVNVGLLTAPGLIRVGVFTHVAAVIDTDAGVMQIYVNGQLMAFQATAGPMVPNTLPLMIGASDVGPSAFFNGLIDEATVYHRGLSALRSGTFTSMARRANSRRSAAPPTSTSSRRRPPASTSWRLPAPRRDGL
jgi:hypothetical protein